jgi:hypothetical protein
MRMLAGSMRVPSDGRIQTQLPSSNLLHDWICFLYS